MKGKCGHSVDKLYRLTNSKDWMCEDCIMDTCDMVTPSNLEEWSEEELRRAGITKE